MRTLGIDLSARQAKTAACAVLWPCDASSPSVEALHVGKLSDAGLVALIREADHAAIDAPFGWPDEFIEAVSSYAASGRFPVTERKRLRYRETDRVVEKEARLPLSVSSDRIAVTAMRCASILTLLGEDGHPIDRAGGGKVREVYPAAALVRWGVDPSGYKTGGNAPTARARILDALAERSTWLHLSPAVREACIRSDDGLDALVCSLVARSAALGLSGEAPAQIRRQAAREGWIHLPEPGSLVLLASGP